MCAPGRPPLCFLLSHAWPRVAADFLTPRERLQADPIGGSFHGGACRSCSIAVTPRCSASSGHSFLKEQNGAVFPGMVMAPGTTAGRGFDVRNSQTPLRRDGGI